MKAEQGQDVRIAPEPVSDPSGSGTGDQFTTVGHALVILVATGEGSYQYSCGGCGARPASFTDRAEAQLAANAHAWRCRAISHWRGEDPEFVRELTVDLRDELHQLDARAGAGMAICGAVLIGVVNQTPLVQPVYTFSVLGASLLTVALLLFLAALLAAPSSSGASRRRERFTISRDGGVGRSVANLDNYMAQRLIRLQVVVRTKRRRFTSAMVASGLALMVVACGAVTALLLGM